MTKTAYLSVDYAYPTSTHANIGGAGYYALVRSVDTAYEIAGPYGPAPTRKGLVSLAIKAINEARQKGWHVNGIDNFMDQLS